MVLGLFSGIAVGLPQRRIGAGAEVMRVERIKGCRGQQGHIIQQLTDAGVRDKVKVMVGGAPVTQMWADKIGADAFTADAAEAAQWAKAYAASKGA